MGTVTARLHKQFAKGGSASARAPTAPLIRGAERRQRRTFGAQVARPGSLLCRFEPPLLNSDEAAVAVDVILALEVRRPAIVAESDPRPSQEHEENEKDEEEEEKEDEEQQEGQQDGERLVVVWSRAPVAWERARARDRCGGPSRVRLLAQNVHHRRHRYGWPLQHVLDVLEPTPHERVHPATRGGEGARFSLRSQPAIEA